MTAIYGIWRLDGAPAQEGALERMAFAGRRGRGMLSTWLEGSVGLACSGTSEGNGSGPLSGRRGIVAFCADCRVDNREELVRNLGLEGPTGSGGPDAALLLSAYERWGPECPRHVQGDFAFVAWDPTLRALVCVRDHFGVRPLYYAHLPGRLFAFASEVQPLLALKEVDPAIDGCAVGRHLLVPVQENPRATFYRNIRSVLSAHVLRVSEHGIAEHAYWELDPESKSTFSSDNECAEALREVFFEAVRRRMRSSVPVAAMLSGGLDSSAIAAVAARMGESRRGTTLHTLSAVYPQIPESDERSYIDAFLGRYDVTPAFFEADSVDPTAEVDAMSWAIGGPIRGRNLYLNWTLCEIARDAGCRVTLDGFDGDSTLSHATNFLTALAVSGRWVELGAALIPLSLRVGSSPWRDLRSYWRFGRRHRAIAAGHISPPVPEVPATMPLNPEFRDRIAGPAPLWEPGATEEREMHARHLTSPRLAEVLGWVESCGAGQGIDVRFPFFDVRLAEFCVSLPPRQKLRRGFSRYAMRRAMEGILPAEIQWRVSKGNMHLGWNHAYRTYEDGRVRDLLGDPAPGLEEYIDAPRALSLHERFLRGDVSRVEEGVWWRVASLALWLGGPATQAGWVPGSSSSSRPRSRSSAQ